MQTFSMLWLTIVICIYSMLENVIINGDEYQPSNLYGLRSYNGESKFQHNLRPNLRTLNYGGSAVIGRAGGYGGPASYEGPGPGIYGVPVVYGGPGASVYGENPGVSGRIGIGREGGIGSDVGLDGTGGNVGNIGRSHIGRHIWG